MIAEIALGFDGLEDALEGNATQSFHGLGIGRESVEKLAERDVAIDFRPQDFDGLRRPDQAAVGLTVPERHGQANREIGLVRVAMKENGVGGEEDDRQIGFLGNRQLLERLRQCAVDDDRAPFAGEGLHRGAGAIERVLERRLWRREIRLPEFQPLTQIRSGEKGSFAFGKLGKTNFALGKIAAPGLGEIAGELRKRRFIENDAMGIPEEVMLVFRHAMEGGGEERAGREIEVPGSERHGRRFHDRTTQPARCVHPGHGLAIDLGEGCAEDIMPRDDFLQCATKAGDVEFSAQAENPGHLMGYRVALEPVEEPQPVLRQRERPIRACTRRGTHTCQSLSQPGGRDERSTRECGWPAGRAARRQAAER